MSGTESARTRSEPGAPAAAGAIPLAVPHLAGNEWAYVKEALDANWVSSAGPFVDRFERMAADLVGTEHAVATSSGTAALHVALLAAGVEPEDEVLVPTLTFIAPANAIRYAGAHPVFVGVDESTWELDPNRVVEFLERECDWDEGRLRNRSSGRRVRAILPVHILGHPVELDPILDAGGRFDLAVVEDAAESLGARYLSRSGWANVGRLGDVGCLSFNGNKLFTTGGGGMIVTDDERIAARARHLTTQAKQDPIGYVHDEIGFNYRLSNVLAALGCAQLEQADVFLAAKRRIAAAYGEGLAGLPGLTRMTEAPFASSAFWLYTVLVDPGEAPLDRERLRTTLEREGIQSRPLWQPLHRSAAHAGAQAYACEGAERIAERSLSLPSSVGLTEDDQRRVIAAVVAAWGRG